MSLEKVNVEHPHLVMRTQAPMRHNRWASL